MTDVLATDPASAQQPLSASPGLARSAPLTPIVPLVPPARARPLLARLRADTGPAHRRLEQAPLLAELSAGDITLQRYALYLRCMHRFHGALERALQVGLPPGYGPTRLNQAACLEADLASLGVPAAALPASSCRAAQALVGGPGAAWGVLYVVEGARLGSQVLLKRNADNAAVQRAHAYIRGEGAATGAGWRVFCAALEHGVQTADADADAAVAAASGAFALLGQWLHAPDN